MFIKLLTKFKEDWKSNLLLLAFFSLLLFFGLWHLPYSPATWFDEGINLGIAKSMVTDGVYSLKVGPSEYVIERPLLITTNYPVLLPVALFLDLFGFSLSVARLPMVIFLVAFYLLSYFYVKKYSYKEAAILSLALIISFAPFYGNGKAVLGEVPGLFFLLFSLLVLPNDYRPKKLLLAGLLAGFSVATKPAFLLVIPAFLVGEIYHYKFSKGFFYRRLFFVVLGALIPLLVWFYIILPSFDLKIFFQMLNFYANSYACNDLLKQVFLNLKRFFIESTPLHFLLLLAVVCFSYFKKYKKRIVVEENVVILLSFILLNFFWYLKTPGWYRYFFTAHLSLLLLFPVSLMTLFKRRTAIIILLLLFSVQMIHLISRKSDALYNSDEVEKFTSSVVHHFDPGKTIYIINLPNLAFALDKQLPVYQYLQINPALHFGSDVLDDQGKLLFDYIITDGHQDETALININNILSTAYQPIYQSGRYILYAKSL